MGSQMLSSPPKSSLDLESSAGSRSHQIINQPDISSSRNGSTGISLTPRPYEESGPQLGRLDLALLNNARRRDSGPLSAGLPDGFGVSAIYHSTRAKV